MESGIELRGAQGISTNDPEADRAVCQHPGAGKERRSRIVVEPLHVRISALRYTLILRVLRRGLQV